LLRPHQDLASRKKSKLSLLNNTVFNAVLDSGASILMILEILATWIVNLHGNPQQIHLDCSLYSAVQCLAVTKYDRVWSDAEMD
jgi:hypothetical protein